MKTLLTWMAAVMMGTGSSVAQEPIKMGSMPQVAALQADREGKLLMVVHLAGHFDDPEKT